MKRFVLYMFSNIYKPRLGLLYAIDMSPKHRTGIQNGNQVKQDTELILDKKHDREVSL